MDSFMGVFTSFGLSTSVGLNAYLPLLIVALTARFTNLIRLNEPFDALASRWAIGVLVGIRLLMSGFELLAIGGAAGDVADVVDDAASA